MGPTQRAAVTHPASPLGRCRDGRIRPHPHSRRPAGLRPVARRLPHRLRPADAQRRRPPAEARLAHGLLRRPRHPVPPTTGWRCRRCRPPGCTCCGASAGSAAYWLWRSAPFYRIAIWGFNAIFIYVFLLDQLLYLNHFYMIALFGLLLGLHRRSSLAGSVDRRLRTHRGARRRCRSGTCSSSNSRWR